MPLKKQFLMMKVICFLYEQGKRVVAASKPIELLQKSGLYERVTKMKYDIPNDKFELFDGYIKDIKDAVDKILEN